MSKNKKVFDVEGHISCNTTCREAALAYLCLWPWKRQDEFAKYLQDMWTTGNNVQYTLYIASKIFLMTCVFTEP